MQLQMTSIFGDWLLERLKEKDMSQAELARAADISRASISDVISGRRNIGKDLAVSIARALRIPPEQIFRNLPFSSFLSEKLNRRMTRTKLAEMFADIGRRAGVKNFHPHRVRHTFAIQYLRNGGNAYTLQAMLGHSTLETVKIYLKIAQVDIDTVHRKASPVDNWRL